MTGKKISYQLKNKVEEQGEGSEDDFYEYVDAEQVSPKVKTFKEVILH